MIARTAAAVFATLLVTVALIPSSAEAQSGQRRYTNSPNSSYMSGPRTRVYVTRRHWLDAGTEVLPGERKYSDYAFPLNTQNSDNLSGRGGFIRRPLPDPWDLPDTNKF